MLEVENPLRPQFRLRELELLGEGDDATYVAATVGTWSVPAVGSAISTQMDQWSVKNIVARAAAM